MKELELYKLLATKDNPHEEPLADEMRWVSDDEFLVWVSYLWLEEFIESLKELFGEGMFDEGGFNGNFQSSGVCIDLASVLDDYGVDLKKVFPHKDYMDYLP